MIELLREEWYFGVYQDNSPEQWKAFANYEYAREAKHVRAYYSKAKSSGKQRRTRTNPFSPYINLDQLAHLVPEFPELTWLQVMKGRTTEEREKIVSVLAPSMPPLMELHPRQTLFNKLTNEFCSHLIVDLGTWLFESVSLRLNRNYSDKEIIKAFGDWLEKHPVTPKTVGYERLNLSVRGIGARVDWEALKFLAAKRLSESQTGEAWKNEFNKAYATRFQERQVRKAIRRLDLDFPSGNLNSTAK